MAFWLAPLTATMSTPRKTDLHLRARTPTYVSREVGAAELCISPQTWDRMVDRKELPLATIVSGMPRGKWETVEAWLSGKRDCATMPEDPYLAMLANGKKQKYRNG
jgi:hypothetical protein